MARTKQVCRRNPYPQLVATKRRMRDHLAGVRGSIKIDLTIEQEAIDLTRSGGMKMDPIVLSDDSSVEETLTETEEEFEASIDPEILYTPPLFYDKDPLAYEEKELADNWFTAYDTDFNQYSAFVLDDWNLLQ